MTYRIDEHSAGTVVGKLDKAPSELFALEVHSIPHKELSPREEQIIDLCSQGFTNEGIAHELGLSLGTVNTYWLRIRTKIGGTGRAEIVSRVIKERAERALREKSSERHDSSDEELVEARSLFDLRATFALLNLAMEGIQSTAWATDRDLTIRIVVNGELSAKRSGVVWEVGKTVYDAFGTTDPEAPGIKAHLAAVDGKRSTVRLQGEYS